MAKIEIKKEHESPKTGHPLVVEFVLGGKDVPMKFFCKVCEKDRFWFAEDHSLIYCSNCRETLCRRFGDFVMTDKVQWKV